MPKNRGERVIKSAVYPREPIYCRSFRDGGSTFRASPGHSFIQRRFFVLTRSRLPDSCSTPNRWLQCSAPRVWHCCVDAAFLTKDSAPSFGFLLAFRFHSPAGARYISRSVAWSTFWYEPRAYGKPRMVSL